MFKRHGIHVKVPVLNSLEQVFFSVRPADLLFVELFCGSDRLSKAVPEADFNVLAIDKVARARHPYAPILKKINLTLGFFNFQSSIENQDFQGRFSFALRPKDIVSMNSLLIFMKLKHRGLNSLLKKYFPLLIL